MHLFPNNYGQSAWNSVNVQPISSVRPPNHAPTAAEMSNRRNCLHYFRNANTYLLPSKFAGKGLKSFPYSRMTGRIVRTPHHLRSRQQHRTCYNLTNSPARHVFIEHPAHLLPIYVILKAAREKEKPYLRWLATSSAESQSPASGRGNHFTLVQRGTRGVCSSLGGSGAGKGEAKVSLLGGADRMLPSRSVKVKTEGWGQGRTHGGGARPPLELGLKNAIFSGFLPLNYVICIFQVCF